MKNKKEDSGKISKEELFTQLTQNIDVMIEAFNKGDQEQITKAQEMMAELNRKIANLGAEKIQKHDLTKPYMTQFFERLNALNALAAQHRKPI